PRVQVFYAPPFVDMHNRMKTALTLLGRLPPAHVRPPLTPVSAAEQEAIRQALVAAGLAPARPSPQRGGPRWTSASGDGTRSSPRRAAGLARRAPCRSPVR